MVIYYIYIFIYIYIYVYLGEHDMFAMQLKIFLNNEYDINDEQEVRDLKFPHADFTVICARLTCTNVIY